MGATLSTSPVSDSDDERGSSLVERLFITEDRIPENWLVARALPFVDLDYIDARVTTLRPCYTIPSRIVQQLLLPKHVSAMNNRSARMIMYTRKSINSDDLSQARKWYDYSQMRAGAAGS